MVKYLTLYVYMEKTGRKNYALGAGEKAQCLSELDVQPWELKLRSQHLDNKLGIILYTPSAPNEWSWK